MASFSELRDNGDGTYSLLVEITDAQHVQQVSQKKTVAQVAVHSAASIRDTANLDIVVDVSQLSGEKVIVVSTTLNQTVNITAYAEGNGYTFAILGLAKGFSSGAGILTSIDLPGLKAPIQKIRIRAACPTAPTTGSLNTYVEGVQA